HPPTLMRASRRVSPLATAWGHAHVQESSLMPRFSLTSPFLFVLALSPSLALAQAAPAGTAPAGAPGSPLPGANPPSSGRGAPSGGAIDRGSLVEPPASQKGGATSAPSTPTPAEPRDTDRTKDVSIGANP